MSVREYWLIVRRYWKLVAAITVAGLLIAALAAVVVPKTYEATASGVVVVSSDSASSAVAADTLAKSKVKSYVSLGKSTAIADAVADQLDLSDDASELTSRITIAAPTNTAALSVTAEASTAQGAADLANAWIAQLKTKIADTEGSSSSTGVPSLKLDGTAAVPQAPTSPKLKLWLAIGLLAGLVIGLAVAITLAVLDRRLRRPEDITEGCELPVIGRLPESATALPAVAAATENRAEDTVWRESLRQLRTSVQFLAGDAPVRSVLVTGPQPGVGSSTVAANLARALVEIGQTVILVDADLRQPSVADRFGIASNPGLAEVLAGQADLQSAMQRERDDLDLFVIAAGAPRDDANELLGSETFTVVLQALTDQAVVIIDGAPTLPVADSAALAPQVEAVLITVAAGVTTSPELAETLAVLEQVGAPIAGAVLNRIPEKGPDALNYGNYGGAVRD